jgi:hypothetical protein
MPEEPLFTDGYALIIGVGKIAGETDSSKDLSVTIAKDVLAIRSVLIDQKKCAYKPENVKLLLGGGSVEHDAGTATRDGILSAFEWLHTQIPNDSNSTVIIYYSGHGGEDKVDKYYYLLPYDFDSTKKSTTAITDQEFINQLQSLNAKRLVVFMDCCHAKGIAAIKDGDIEGTTDFEQYIKSDNFVSKNAPQNILDFIKTKDISPNLPPITSELQAGFGRALFASSTAEEISFGGLKADDNSIFTKCLLDALSGNGVQGNVVKMSHIWNYVDVAVPKNVNELKNTVKALYPDAFPNISEKKQTPIFETSGTNFAICYKAGVAATKGIENVVGTTHTEQPENNGDIYLSGIVYYQTSVGLKALNNATVSVAGSNTIKDDITDGGFLMGPISFAKKPKQISLKINDITQHLDISEYKDAVYVIKSPLTEGKDETINKLPNWRYAISGVAVLFLVSLFGIFSLLRDSDGRSYGSKLLGFLTTSNTPTPTPPTNVNAIVTEKRCCVDQENFIATNAKKRKEAALSTIEFNPFYYDRDGLHELPILDFSPTIYVLIDNKLIDTWNHIDDSSEFERKYNQESNVKFWASYPPNFKPESYIEGKLEMRQLVEYDNVFKSDEFAGHLAKFVNLTGDSFSACYCLTYVQKIRKFSIPFPKSSETANFKQNTCDSDKPIFEDIIYRVYQVGKEPIAPKILNKYFEMLKNERLPKQLRRDIIKAYLTLPTQNRTSDSEWIKYLTEQTSDTNSLIRSQSFAALFVLNHDKETLLSLRLDDVAIETKLMALGEIITAASITKDVDNKNILACFKGVINNSDIEPIKKTAIRQLGIFSKKNGFADGNEYLKEIAQNNQNSCEIVSTAAKVLNSQVSQKYPSRTTNELGEIKKALKIE